MWILGYILRKLENLKTLILDKYEEYSYLLNRLILWLKHPLAWFYFLLFLIINSLLSLLFIFPYLVFYIYWWLEFLFFIINKTELRLDILNMETKNIFLYYIKIEVFFRAYALSFSTFYNTLKIILKKTKTLINWKPLKLYY